MFSLVWYIGVFRLALRRTRGFLWCYGCYKEQRICYCMWRVVRCTLFVNCPFTGKYERVLEFVVVVYHRAVTIFDRFHDANWWNTKSSRIRNAKIYGKNLLLTKQLKNSLNRSRKYRQIVVNLKIYSANYSPVGVSHVKFRFNSLRHRHQMNILFVVSHQNYLAVHCRQRRIV